jgi:flagella basal body P-ring formation protein FlgA
MKFQGLATAVLLTLSFSAFAGPAFAGESVKALPLGAPPAIPASHELDTDTADRIRLNPSITVTGDVIHLGDVFSGYLVRPEKVVANAPRPGQRVVLSADWLTTLAHTYGLEWRPASAYDRAVVYQPGQTVSPSDILGAVRGALKAKGMPANFDLSATSQVEAVTVPMGTSTDVGVREAYYDAGAKAFTAVVEIPAGDPKAFFVPLRGVAFATVPVPVLKENAVKNKIITEAMIDMVNVREELVKSTTVTDPNLLVGKAPKFFVKGGLPIQESEVAQVHLIDVPVMGVETSRDTAITKGQIVMATFNASDLPQDAVLDAAQLVGKTPRRNLPAGTPVRRGDVQFVRQVQVPVAARDFGRGEMLAAGDLTFITLTDADVVGNVITDLSEIVGRSTKHAMRAGQMMHSFDIARPVAVERGKLVTIIYSVPMMNLTSQGIAQEPGGVGDAIRVTNNKSNATIVGEVIDARTVRIGMKQTASAN